MEHFSLSNQQAGVPRSVRQCYRSGVSTCPAESPTVRLTQPFCSAIPKGCDPVICLPRLLVTVHLSFLSLLLIAIHGRCTKYAIGILSHTRSEIALLATFGPWLLISLSTESFCLTHLSSSLYCQNMKLTKRCQTTGCIREVIYVALSIWFSLLVNT